MRAFIIGSKELSCIVLDGLIAGGHEVLGVYSRDKEAGMKTWHELGHRSLDELATAHSIPVYHDMKVNSTESLQLLSSLNLDVIFSCFWSEIFRPTILAIPRLGIYNIHAALLPKYRGSRPIPWAIINGETKAGLTVHKMLSGIDNGPIVDQLSVAIEKNDTAESVYARIMIEARAFIPQVIDRYTNEGVKLIEQDDEQSTYYPRGEPFGRQINRYWTEDFKDRFKRAYIFSPFAVVIPPPPCMLATGPRLVVGLISKDEIITSIDADFNLYEHGIGNADQRKRLKHIFGSIQNPTLSTSIDGMFMVHDVIQGLGASYVSSKIIAIGSWPTDLLSNQPHRYENGLLEIPRIEVNSNSELDQVIDIAASIISNSGADVYAALRLDDQFDGSVVLEELENSNVLVVSASDIADHFNSSR